MIRQDYPSLPHRDTSRRGGGVLKARLSHGGGGGGGNKLEGRGISGALHSPDFLIYFRGCMMLQQLHVCVQEKPVLLPSPARS